MGVALKLVQAICARLGRERWLPAFVKMAAIGTLADVVPLLGENRVIAKVGLAALSRGPNAVGLRALIEAAGLAGKRLDSYHVAYLLAPRVNAAGRMASPDIAARLLLATDESLAGEARGLAAQLNDENLRRQQEEAEIVGQARKTIETDPTIGAHNLLIVAGDGWHRGVIGIVASKIVDAFHKPTIVLSVEDGLAHGSCRSIPGFDMLGALERVADVFVRFGGHRQAAGLTIETARIPELRARLTAFADEVLEPDQLVPRLRVDGAAAAARHHRRRRLGARRARAVRRRQPAAGLPRLARGARGRAAHDQGPPPRAVGAAAGARVPRHRLARRRARGLPRRAPRRARPRVLARGEPVPRRDLHPADGRRHPALVRRRGRAGVR